MSIIVIGIDLAKSVFAVHDVSELARPNWSNLAAAIVETSGSWNLTRGARSFLFPGGKLKRDFDVAQVARGKVVYEKSCLECHGAGGKGQMGDWRMSDAQGYFPPPPLDDSAHAWHHSTAVLLEIIRDGSPQGQGRMPAWKGKLTEQEMQDVVTYIKSLWSDEVYRLWWKWNSNRWHPEVMSPERGDDKWIRVFWPTPNVR